ncbi:putative nucleotidyltransferase substrate binding domain-containing protein [Nocardioides massiliensis]|uniref:CBS domain-containing protein n=1 Tax=Nocardioides massiliensis TaxID=1325935 RepID=A0ABT9NUC9_9ACTN|nr:putative nucleotidyltransferase substrate binding domain-containing protein [Nocardioides massiliensis]MDP9824032.1 CBS domain-containing protein [Nocardioides massiliensis]
MPLDVELAEIRDFLAGHEPFASLPPDVLSSIPARLSVVYRRRGTLVQDAGTVPEELLVVRSGAVELRDPDGELVERGSAGLCLGGSALAAGTPQPVAAHAIEDTLLLACPAVVFHQLRAEHDGFSAFFEQRGGQLREAVASQRARHMTDADRAVLQTHVRDLVRRPPVAVRADEPIVEAARLMSIERISSLLVTDDDRLVGILTDRDLRTRVLAAGIDPSAPVAAVMTKDPVTVGPDALAIEALLELVRRNIHHLPVLDAGRPIGMITDTDLIRLQQASPVFLVGDIAKARDVTVVAALAARLPGVVAGLVRQGTSARDAGRVVTTVGDAIEARLLELAEAELGAPPVPYAWVTLGSRARFEQALAPDQDHALVLHDDYRPDAHAAYFRELAEHVTSGLEAVGYPRCRGEKMATNPQWRQPLAAWRADVARWVDNPAPQAVLEASVFFDLRHLYGDPALSAALAATQRAAAQRGAVFLAHLAAHAASAQPPLGFFRGLVVDRAGEHRDTLDLKRGGINIIVEIARLHGLAAGSEETSTVARLEDAVAAGRLSAALGADLRDAWEFLAHVRLRNQVDQVRHGQPPSNRIAPASLSHFEKRHLKDAFGVIRTAQEALAHRYPVRGLM